MEKLTIFSNPAPSLEDYLSTNDLFTNNPYSEFEEKVPNTEEEPISEPNKEHVSEPAMDFFGQIEESDPSPGKTLFMDQNITEIICPNDRTSISEELVIDGYKAILSGTKTGMYSVNISGDIQLSNYVVLLEKWIKMQRNEETVSYFKGKIILYGQEMAFDKLPAPSLTETGTLMKFIENICGPKASLYAKPKEVALAIRKINANVPLFIEQEFGYDKSVSSYITEDLIITPDNFISKETPLKNKETWGNSRLGFKLIPEDQMPELKRTILEKFLSWDNPKIMYNALAFTFYPLIYPYLKDTNPNKFYLMLKGHSGSGKSQMSKWFQSFYGYFPTLLAWSSTCTSISIIGSALKDALLAVDDLKIQNFRTEADVRTVMMTLQNYSDCTGRQRANIDLKIRDEHIIKSHLLLSAEDLVVSESSTIARGVIINVEPKDVDMASVNEINTLSKEFSGITPYLIQHLLKTMSAEKAGQIFHAAHRSLTMHPLINDPEISKDNLPRILNNFAALKTSWQIVSEFLMAGLPQDIKDTYDDTFEQNLIGLLKENIDRINSYKQDVIFEQRLWDLIEDETFALQRIFPDGSRGTIPYRSKSIGYYSIENGNAKIVLQLSTIIREMKSRIDNFFVSEDTLITKLKNERKIKTNQSKKFSLNDVKVSGVAWIGPYPKNLFGIKEDFDPVEEASKIIFDSEQIEDDNFIF